MTDCYSASEMNRRIRDVKGALQTVLQELRTIRFHALAALILDKAQDTRNQWIEVDITESRDAHPLLPDQETITLHLRLCCHPGKRCIDIPPDLSPLIPAEVTGPGSFVFDPRAESSHRQLVQDFRGDPEIAVTRLARQMDECFGARHLLTAVHSVLGITE